MQPRSTNDHPQASNDETIHNENSTTSAPAISFPISLTRTYYDQVLASCDNLSFKPFMAQSKTPFVLSRPYHIPSGLYSYASTATTKTIFRFIPLSIASAFKLDASQTLQKIPAMISKGLMVYEYGANLTSEYVNNPDSRWFITATTRFLVDEGVYGTLWGVMGTPFIVPTTLDYLHDIAKEAQPRQSKYYEDLLNQPVKGHPYGHALHVQNECYKHLFCTTLLGFTTVSRFTFNKLRACTAYATERLIDDGYMETAKSLIGLLGDDGEWLPPAERLGMYSQRVSQLSNQGTYITNWINHQIGNINSVISDINQYEPLGTLGNMLALLADDGEYYDPDTRTRMLDQRVSEITNQANNVSSWIGHVSTSIFNHSVRIAQESVAELKNLAIESESKSSEPAPKDIANLLTPEVDTTHESDNVVEPPALVLNWQIVNRNNEHEASAGYEPTADIHYNTEISTQASAAIPDNENTSLPGSDVIETVATPTTTPQYTYVPAPVPIATSFSDQFEITDVWTSKNPNGIDLNIKLKSQAVISLGLAVTQGVDKLNYAGVLSVNIPLAEGFLGALASGAAICFAVSAVVLTFNYFYQRDQKRISKKLKHAAERTQDNVNDIFKTFNQLNDDLKSGKLSANEFEKLLRKIEKSIKAEHEKMQLRELYAYSKKQFSAVYLHLQKDWQIKTLYTDIAQHASLNKRNESALNKLNQHSVSDIIERFKCLSEKSALTLDESIELSALKSRLSDQLKEDLSLHEISKIQELSGATVSPVQIMPDYNHSNKMQELPRKSFHGNKGRMKKKAATTKSISTLIDAYQIVKDVAEGKRNDMSLSDAINKYNRAKQITIKELAKYKLHKNHTTIVNAAEYYAPQIEQLSIAVNALELNHNEAILTDDCIRQIMTNTYLSKLNKCDDILADENKSPEQKQQASDERYQTAQKIKDLNLTSSEIAFGDDNDTSNKETPSSESHDSHFDTFNKCIDDIISTHILTKGQYCLQDGMKKLSKIHDLERILDDSEASLELKSAAFENLYKLSNELLILIQQHPDLVDVLNASIENKSTSLANDPVENDKAIPVIPLTVDQINDHLSTHKNNFELSNGDHSFLTKIMSLQQLLKDNKTNDAYQLAKKIRSESSHPQVREICHKVIIETYRFSNAVFTTPLANVGLYVVTDQIMRRGSQKSKAIVAVANTLHTVSPSALSSVLSIPLLALYGDGKDGLKMTFDKMSEQLGSHLQILPSGANKLNQLHHKTYLLESLYGYAQQHGAYIIRSILDWFARYSDNYFITALAPALDYITKQFMNMNRMISAQLASLSNKSEQLPRLSTITGICATLETTYTFVTEKNMGNRQHTLLVDQLLNHTFKSIEYMLQNNMPETTAYYHAKDVISAVIHILMYFQIKNYPTLTAAIEKSLIYLYNLLSGNYNEAVVSAKMNNIHYLLKNNQSGISKQYKIAKSKLSELENELKTITTSTEYRQTDSHVVRTGRLFHLEATCQLALRNNNYNKIIRLTDIQNKDNQAYYSASHIPLDCSYTSIILRFEALINNYLQSFTSVDVLYDEYNAIANHISDDSIRVNIAKKILAAHIHHLVKITYENGSQKQESALRQYAQLELIKIEKNNLLSEHSAASLTYANTPTKLNYLQVLNTVPTDAMNDAVIKEAILIIREINHIVPGALCEDTMNADLEMILHDKLCQVAADGNIVFAKRLLDLGAAQNAPYDLSFALHYATLAGHNKMVKLLLKYGADINSVTDSMTPLQTAVLQGHSDTVITLVHKGANMNCQNASGQTSLHVAVENNHSEMVKILLSLGADSKIKDNNGHTAFVISKVNNYSSLIDIFTHYYKHCGFFSASAAAVPLISAVTHQPCVQLK